MTPPQMLTVSYRTRPIAMVFAEFAQFTDSMAALPENDPLRHFAGRMVGFAEAIVRGEHPGPYSHAAAEAHARRELLPEDLGPLLHHTDQRIAELFEIPVEQVTEHRLHHANDPTRRSST